jgi:hypothetical protein
MVYMKAVDGPAKEITNSPIVGLQSTHVRFGDSIILYGLHVTRVFPNEHVLLDLNEIVVTGPDSPVLTLRDRSKPASQGHFKTGQR